MMRARKERVELAVMPLGDRNVTNLTIEGATAANLDTVLRLLVESGLPVADLDQHIEAFILAKSLGSVVGTVGLEVYGELGLLRSLCVAHAHRSQGIAGTLLTSITSRAAAQGVRTLYLLTTGAEPYFADRGFAPVSRKDVPHEIRGTAQFSGLCPSTALCMSKAIVASSD